MDSHRRQALKISRLPYYTLALTHVAHLQGLAILCSDYNQKENDAVANNQEAFKMKGYRQNHRLDVVWLYERWQLFKRRFHRAYYTLVARVITERGCLQLEVDRARKLAVLLICVITLW